MSGPFAALLSSLIAIVGPDVRPASDPAIVRVDIRAKEGRGLCTGVVIGERAVLTAAHCVTPQALGEGASFSVAGVPVRRVSYDPDFDLQHVRLGHDVAVLVAERALAVTPLPFDDEPALDEATSVRVVGFGVRDDGESGEAYEAEIALASVNEKFLELGVDGEAPCLGDSGAPVFVADHLVGIVSYAQGCASFAKITRLAAYAPYLRARTEESRGCNAGDADAALVLAVAVALVVRWRPRQRR